MLYFPFMNLTLKKERKKTAGAAMPRPEQQLCFEGESLDNLLKGIEREIESARSLDIGLPEKVWLKQQFSMGVNEVTRLLERKAPQLQAILLASDCNPRWLTKHLLSLAVSRRVPLLFVKDNKKASLRLGEMLKLKTAIAVGVKARGNTINHFIGRQLLSSNHG